MEEKGTQRRQEKVIKKIKSRKLKRKEKDGRKETEEKGDSQPHHYIVQAHRQMKTQGLWQ